MTAASIRLIFFYFAIRGFLEAYIQKILGLSDPAERPYQNLILPSLFTVNGLAFSFFVRFFSKNKALVGIFLKSKKLVNVAIITQT